MNELYIILIAVLVCVLVSLIIIKINHSHKYDGDVFERTPEDVSGFEAEEPVRVDSLVSGDPGESDSAGTLIMGRGFDKKSRRGHAEQKESVNIYIHEPDFNGWRCGFCDGENSKEDTFCKICEQRRNGY